jgi:hypothetical protein
MSSQGCGNCVLQAPRTNDHIAMSRMLCLSRRARSGYVMQDDLLNGGLSCAEVLTYTTRLRCPEDTTVEQREVRDLCAWRLTRFGSVNRSHAIARRACAAVP